MQVRLPLKQEQLAQAHLADRALTSNFEKFPAVKQPAPHELPAKHIEHDELFWKKQYELHGYDLRNVRNKWRYRHLTCDEGGQERFKTNEIFSPNANLPDVTEIPAYEMPEAIDQSPKNPQLQGNETKPEKKQEAQY